jgi:UV DNA damage endonuclease
MNLSLCCISKTLSDNGQSFRSMTYTQFAKLPRNVAIQELSERILHNFKMTLNTIRFCQLNNIQGYRISSSLAPVLTHKNVMLRIADLPNYASIVSVCESIKQLLRSHPIRLSAHPSEYITLSYSNQDCINNSILDLQQHAEIFNLLNLPQDYRSPLNIHVRQETSEPQKLADKVLRVYDQLPDNVRQRIVLENNDNAKGVWGIKNLIKYFYNSRKIPVTYDSLHHSILHDDLSAEEAFNLAYDTWPTTPLFHYSEGIDGTRKHADMPVSTPTDYGREVYWDVEIKAKCQAIFRIRELTKQKISA